MRLVERVRRNCDVRSAAQFSGNSIGGCGAGRRGTRVLRSAMATAAGGREGVEMRRSVSAGGKADVAGETGEMNDVHDGGWVEARTEQSRLPKRQSRSQRGRGENKRRTGVVVLGSVSAVSACAWCVCGRTRSRSRAERMRDEGGCGEADGELTCSPGLWMAQSSPVRTRQPSQSLFLPSRGTFIADGRLTLALALSTSESRRLRRRRVCLCLSTISSSTVL